MTHSHQAAEGAGPDGLARPPITIRQSEHVRLQDLALAAMLRTPRGVGALIDELSRAEVRPDHSVPADVAGLGSLVTFRDLEDLQERSLRLVVDETASAGTVSVLSPLGAALLGLAPGQSILWPDRRGGRRRLFVEAVQPRGV
jgi:regulator of nucleoside diphosphate kinase